MAEREFAVAGVYPISPIQFALFLVSADRIPLEEKDPLVISIDAVAAQGIQASRQLLDTPRPLTHALLADTLESLGATVSKVVITKFEQGTYFAVVHVKSKGGASFEKDARPSDAVALALRTSSPIYVEDKVMEDTISTYEAGAREAYREVLKQIIEKDELSLLVT